MELERRGDTWTILAIGMLALLLANVVHEGLGHGGVCLLVGGRPVALSSAWFEGDTAGVSAWGRRAELAGGTLANLIVGALLMALLRLWRPRSPQAFYFLWLAGIVDLFQGGGYLLTSPLLGFGDWREFVQGLEPLWAWKVGLTLLGLLLYSTSLWLGARTLVPLVAGAGADARRLARRLCWLPYLVVGGGVFSLAAAFNPYGPAFMLTSALAHLGGCAWLVWLPEWVRPGAPAQEALGSLARRKGWLVAGALGALVCVLGLGPSVSLRFLAR